LRYEKAFDGIRTRDPLLTKKVRYPCATKAGNPEARDQRSGKARSLKQRGSLDSQLSPLDSKGTWRGEDLNLRRLTPTILQTVPFDQTRAPLRFQRPDAGGWKLESSL
jgi:hypothetical protein